MSGPYWLLACISMEIIVAPRLESIDTSEAFEVGRREINNSGESNQPLLAIKRGVQVDLLQTRFRNSEKAQDRTLLLF